MAARCNPPKSIKVKGHWRTVKARRRKRKPSSSTTGAYWIAENGTTSCGHHHKKWTAAAACARRTQRLYTKRYGRKAAGIWVTKRGG